MKKGGREGELSDSPGGIPLMSAGVSSQASPSARSTMRRSIGCLQKLSTPQQAHLAHRQTPPCDLIRVPVMPDDLGAIEGTRRPFHICHVTRDAVREPHSLPIFIRQRGCGGGREPPCRGLRRLLDDRRAWFGRQPTFSPSSPHARHRRPMSRECDTIRPKSACQGGLTPRSSTSGPLHLSLDAPGPRPCPTHVSMAWHDLEPVGTLNPRIQH